MHDRSMSELERVHNHKKAMFLLFIEDFQFKGEALGDSWHLFKFKDDAEAKKFLDGMDDKEFGSYEFSFPNDNSRDVKFRFINEWSKASEMVKK